MLPFIGELRPELGELLHALARAARVREQVGDLPHTFFVVRPESGQPVILHPNLPGQGLTVQLSDIEELISLRYLESNARGDSFRVTAQGHSRYTTTEEPLIPSEEQTRRAE